MTREVQSVLLVLVGGAILRITVGGEYLSYVKEGMRPWLIATGVLLVLGGVLLLVDVLRAARAGVRGEAVPEAEHGHDDGHGHGSGGPRSAWLLLLPVLAIFLVAPPPLGAFTAAREQSTVVRPSEPQAPPLPPGDPVSVSLADYAARAVWDDGRTLVGRTVRLTGFVTPNPAGGWWLTRLQTACCAADAIPTKIVPVGGPERLPANTWLTVVGTWVPGGGTQSATATPWVKVESSEKIPQPKNPYE